MALFGVSYWVWALVAAGIGVVYLRLVPAAAASAPAWSRWGVRYLHALTWFVLAAACAVAAFTGSVDAARPVAWLALPSYVGFLAASLAARPRSNT